MRRLGYGKQQGSLPAVHFQADGLKGHGPQEGKRILKHVLQEGIECPYFKTQAFGDRKPRFPARRLKGDDSSLVG
jgi:hypothetical protein